MEFKKRPQSSVSAAQLTRPASQTVKPAVPVQRLAIQQVAVQRDLQEHTTRPVSVQRLVVQPALRAAELNTQESQRLGVQRQALQREAAELGPISPEAITQAVQRQQQKAPQVPLKPQSVGDWVTVMRFQAEQAQGHRMQPREAMQYTALQRQVANTIAQGFRQDRQPASERHQQYAGHLATLQRSPASAPVATVALGLMPAGERPAVQRALDEVLQREAEQQAQDAQAMKLHSIQRQLDELEQEATRPVMQRIQERRGSGNPLPEAIQRHLEQGLNHDLSNVRIHDDQEADKMAKKVNAVAFTTGQDIYFRSGKFNPNSQSGLELLAHEVTHTVQQAKGEVGPGLDPSASHEAQARNKGRELASKPIRLSKHPVKPLSPLRAGGGFALKGLQRAPAATKPGATPQMTFKIGELPFWQAIPGGMLEGAKQSLVDVWELIKNLPVITRELPALTKRALAWLKTMDTVQEWKAVAQALAMGALTAGENWLKKTAAQQGQQVGWFVGQLIGQVALGKGTGAVVKSVKGGGGLVKWFEDFMRKVQAELKKLNAKLPRIGGQPALAGAGGDVRAVTPSPTQAPTNRVNTARRSAGGTVDPRDLEVKKLMGHVPSNFSQVRDLIGLPFDKKKLPKDYYVKNMGGVEVIVRKAADDKKFTPLTIDSNGRVQVNVSQRLSNPTTMKKNFKKDWGVLPSGHWIHHLIPDTLIRNHPVGKALQKLGFSVDEGQNLLNLPGKGVFDSNVDVVGHWTDHPKYTRYVRDELDVLKDKYDPLDSLTTEQAKNLLQEIRSLENDLRKLIQQDFFEKRPDGSLASAPQQNEGRQA